MRIWMGAASLVAAVCAVGPVAAAPVGYTDLYVFGDSLSDAGRAFVMSGGAVPPTPPYYAGQFTGPDGPVWAEILGAAVAVGGGEVRNYAIGGAEALGAGPTDLAAQVAAFGFDVVGGDATPGNDPLAAFWMGANDIFQALGAGAAVPVAELAADAVTQAAAGLSLLGVDSYLFFTFGDLGQLPAFIGTPAAPAATAAGKAFDAELRSNVAELRAMGLDARIVDTGALFAAARADPAAFGFANVAAPCVRRDGAVILQDCTGVPGVDASEYLWFDPVHPSSRAHAFIAEAALARITPIPSPAALPLAFAGFALLFGVGRRRMHARR